MAMALDQYQSISININQYHPISTNIKACQGQTKARAAPSGRSDLLWISSVVQDSHHMTRHDNYFSS
jgi:D-hexose-6-phosphate mutarotase